MDPRVGGEDWDGKKGGLGWGPQGESRGTGGIMMGLERGQTEKEGHESGAMI